MTVWNYSSHAFNGSVGFKITTAKKAEMQHKAKSIGLKLEFSGVGIGAWMLDMLLHETIDLPKHFAVLMRVYINFYPAYRGEA